MNAELMAYAVGNARREGNGYRCRGPLADEQNHCDAVCYLLYVGQAAGRLGVWPTWLYCPADRLPFTCRPGRHLSFDATRLERWPTHRTGCEGTR
jgi:hypothetical protein